MDDAIDIILTYSKYVGQYLLDMKLEYDDGKEVKDDTYEIHIQEIKRMLENKDKMKETVIKIALMEGIYAMFNDYRYRKTPKGYLVDCAKDYKEKYSEVKGMYRNSGNNILNQLFNYDAGKITFGDEGLIVDTFPMEIKELLDSYKLCRVLKKLYQTRIIFQKVIDTPIISKVWTNGWKVLRNSCTVKSNHMEISEYEKTNQQLGEDNDLYSDMQILIDELEKFYGEWGYFKSTNKLPIKKNTKLKF